MTTYGGPSITYANALLKCAFGDDHTGDFPASWWLCYLTTPPLADGSGSAEPNPAFGYNRIEIPNDTAHWVVPAGDGMVWNAQEVTFDVATGLWGVPTWYGLSDSGTIGSGDFIAVNPISAYITIDDDIRPQWAIGDVVITAGHLAA